MSRLLELVEVMDRLRRECPWDKEQTHESLVKYLVEETYETVEAIESGDYAHLQEELGDLLLQVYFHARIASEADEGFTVEDVAGGIVDKLVYRHPHVFAGLEVADADEVNANWEQLKAAEKKRESPLDGVPRALPALVLADKVLGRLGRTAPIEGNGIGDRLLALVQEARAAGVDPEQALRTSLWDLVEASG
ncbi:MAG: MazG family protein [Nocardioidaceae bacterium]